MIREDNSLPHIWLIGHWHKKGRNLLHHLIQPRKCQVSHNSQNLILSFSCIYSQTTFNKLQTSTKLETSDKASSSLDKFKGSPTLSLGTCLMAQMIRNLSAMQKTWVQSLGEEDTLEKEMATQSSVLAWRIPCQAPRDWTHVSFVSCIGREVLYH